MMKSRLKKMPKFPRRKPSTRVINKKQKDDKQTQKSQPSTPPITHTIISQEQQQLPTKDKDGYLSFPDYSNFRPNLTPKQVLELGSFGGTYFRPINSSVTRKHHENEWKELPEDWFKSLSAKQFRSSSYDDSVNKYGVSCGGDLHMWESSGWIREIDPYGWFQWYCRFYLGRRCSDDERQIARGLGVFGPTGRWKRNLVNQCLSRIKDPKNEDHLIQVLNDYTISPKIRQLLQHWGYELTLKDLEGFKSKK